MSEVGVKKHLEELREASPDQYELVRQVRDIVRSVAPEVCESVMYGGIVFAAPVQFCGVFAYAEHVSVEFSRGYELDDPMHVLEGSGKLRRHIKLRVIGDVEAKRVRDYVSQAHDEMRPE